MKMEAFFTREKANEGTEVPLSHPDGTKTDYHLVIRSQWSDAFQQAKQDAYRQDMEALTKGEAVDSTERHVTLCAALVAGSSALPRGAVVGIDVADRDMVSE